MALAQRRMEWSICGESEIEINNFDVGAMPIEHPGPMPFILSGRVKREIRGVVKSDFKIIRTVSGIALPIRCYLVNGNYIGSCVYPDLCLMLKNYFNFEPNNCFN